MAGDSGEEHPRRRPSFHIVVGGERGSAAQISNPADPAGNEEVLVDAVIGHSEPQHGSAWAPSAPQRRIKRRGRTFTHSLKTGKNAKAPVTPSTVPQVLPTASSNVNEHNNSPDTSNWAIAQLKHRV